MLYLARLSKNEIMESCYNLFEKYNWDLTQFNNDTDLFIEEVRKNAREYAKNVLNKPLNKEQVWCLMPRNIRTIFNDYNEIIRQMLHDKIISYENLLDIEWMINTLRLNVGKFCFDICEKLNWIIEDIDSYCEQNNILSQSLKTLTRQYIIEVLKWDEKQRDDHWRQKVSFRRERNFSKISENDGIFAKLYIQLSKAQTNEEIIKIFTDFNRPYFNIRHGLTDLITAYNVSNEIKEDIFNKLQIYGEYLKYNRNEHREQEKIENENNYIKNNLDIAVSTVKQYINGQYDDINKYCADMNLERKTFDKYLNLIKNNDEQLYNNYLQHLENNKNKIYEDLLSRSLIVIDMMKHGVTENGVKREFDLVDYYRYLPLGFDRMLRVVRVGINQEDYKLLSSYVGKNKNDRELSDTEINNIYNMKTMVDVQFDDDNKIIPGSGREITIEEKQNIIKYLKDNNIPVTNKTYNIIYKRWLLGDLVLVKEEKDKKK